MPLFPFPRGGSGGRVSPAIAPFAVHQDKISMGDASVDAPPSPPDGELPQHESVSVDDEPVDAPPSSRDGELPQHDAAENPRSCPDAATSPQQELDASDGEANRDETPRGQNTSTGDAELDASAATEDIKEPECEQQVSKSEVAGDDEAVMRQRTSTDDTKEMPEEAATEEITPQNNHSCAEENDGHEQSSSADLQAGTSDPQYELDQDCHSDEFEETGDVENAHEPQQNITDVPHSVEEDPRQNRCGVDSGEASDEQHKTQERTVGAAVAQALSWTSFKEKAVSAVKEATAPIGSSHFHEWSDDALIDLLVRHNVQLRGAGNLSRETLLRLCDQLFAGKIDETPPRKSQLHLISWDDVAKADTAVRRIQKAYIQKRKRDREEMRDIENNPYFSPGRKVPGYISCQLEDGDRRDESTNRRQSTKLSIRHRQPQEFRHMSMLRRVRDNDLDEEIEVEWVKPSWIFAKRHESLNRPHKPGKDMERYNWKRTTLGRHCIMGGCGEQLDLWDEGKLSEFAQFGSGITNYFKFVKWCCWIFFVLSILHLPILTANVFGVTIDGIGTLSMSSTTFGNLGDASIGSIRIPGCDDGLYRFDNCTIDKQSLAKMYAFIDGIGTLLVIAGWLWLRVFEKKEEAHLDRCTVTASDYTLRILNIPPYTKEKELAAHFAALTGEAVAAVHLAYANGKEIQMYFKRGEIMRSRFDCIQKIRFQKTMLKNQDPRYSRRTLRAMLKEREILTGLVLEQDDIRSTKVSPKPTPIQAFVTFETETGYVKAMSAYQLSWLRAACCLYPRHLRFKGTKLQVTEAPEPSTIIWENLEYSSTSRFLRGCLTTGVALVAILLSIGCTFLARDFQNKTLESTSSACPDGFLDLSHEEQYDIVNQNIELSHCYCDTLGLFEQTGEIMCRDYLKGKAKAAGMSYGAGFIVVFMNVFFTWLMDKAGSFEKHESLNAMESSVMLRVFLLKFVNTGCLVLLYNRKWIQRLVRIRFDDSPLFDVDWYDTGGVSLIIVMCINIISPHMISFFQYRGHRRRINAIDRHLTDKKDTDDSHKIWYTQDELNQVYVGPNFRLNYRYTQLLVNFFICWIYAVSMPILTFIGAISFFVSYWVDKFLFCNFYRVPPRYSDKMGRTSTRLVGVCIVLHLIMSIWTMGNRLIFRGANLDTYDIGFSVNIPKKAMLAQDHLLVLECLLVTFVTSAILSMISSSFRNRLLKLFRCLVCSTGNKTSQLKAKMNTVQVTYSSAVDRGIIRGLSTYNVLQNPKYQEAFAISDDFAANHKRLSQIRGLNTKEATALSRVSETTTEDSSDARLSMDGNPAMESDVESG